MSQHPSLRHFLRLLTALLITSCNGQSKEDALTNTDQPSIARTPTELLVVSRDSMAAHAPNDITRNVLQDRSGRFWFATWEGIIKYDGKRFTNVTETEGLEKFHVFSLLEDRTGVLWFGTIGGGLYRYDGSSFVRYTTADGLPDNSILCMLEDKVGNIWFGTDSGATRYDGKTFTHFASQDSVAINVNCMAQDSSGRIWFATRYGVDNDLYSYDGRSFASIERAPGIRFSNVRTVIVDRVGNLWAGGEDGLVRSDGSSPEVSGRGRFTQVSPHFIGCIFEDRAGKLWLSEDSPGIGWTLKRSDGNSAIPIATGSMIFGSTEDASGNIWFGTTDGIGRYDGKTVTRFRH